MEFSGDGKNILVSTKAGMALVLDTYEYCVDRIVQGYTNTGGMDIRATYSPGSANILTGSEDGQVYVYDAQQERTMDGPIHKLKGHMAPVRQVVCNPKYEVVATACSNVVLWINSKGS